MAVDSSWKEVPQPHTAVLGNPSIECISIKTMDGANTATVVGEYTKDKPNMMSGHLLHLGIVWGM